MTLGSLLDATGSTAGEVASHVAGQSLAECLGECLALSAAQQRRLWQLASSAAAAPAGELLADTTATFAGRNSLRLFSRFEKWFARQDGLLIGCNRHALGPLIGPGYFSVRDDGSQRLEFDYGTGDRSVFPEIEGVAEKDRSRNTYHDLSLEVGCGASEALESDRVAAQ